MFFSYVSYFNFIWIRDIWIKDQVVYLYKTFLFDYWLDQIFDHVFFEVRNHHFFIDVVEGWVVFADLGLMLVSVEISMHHIHELLVF